MGEDNPTLPDVYKRQDKHRDEILSAIGGVNQNVQKNSVQIAGTKATVDGFEARMAANEKQNDKRDKRMDKIEGRLWKLAGAGGVSGALASLLLKLVFG